jgi:hypothetical protein
MKYLKLVQVQEKIVLILNFKIMTDLQFRFYAFSIMFIIFDLVAIGFTYSIIKQLYYESFP